MHRMNALSLRSARGFSLFELLMALVLGGILAGIGLPSFRSVLLNSQRTAAVNDFVAALHLARIEAFKARSAVVVCPLRDGGCALASSGWNEGWLVFVNSNGDEPPRLDDGERVLRVFEKEAEPIEVRSNRSVFVFRPFGKRDLNGTTSFCDPRGIKHSRAVVVAHSGRVRTADPRTARIDCA